METPELWTNIEINIPHESSNATALAVSDLLDEIATLVFSWAETHGVDPAMHAHINDSIPEWLAETDDPLQDPLACEADSESIKETFGELVDRVGEREAMNFLLAQSIGLRSAIYALCEAVEHDYAPHQSRGAQTMKAIQHAKEVSTKGYTKTND
jgi:hypothetical protein